jgi:hypothetical protein
MEEIIRDEFVSSLREKLIGDGGKEVDSYQLFNLTVMNVLWGMVAGTRYNINFIKESSTQ